MSGVVRELLGLGERMDLAVHIQFPDAPSNELGVLGTVVEDEDGAGQDVGSG